MKEHQNSSCLLRANNYPSIASTTGQDQPIGNEALSKVSENTPCIVVRGFSDLHHFLSWFQIDVQHPLIFPCNQERYIKQERECITICGYENLEAFLACFARDGGRRPTVPLVSMKTLAKKDVKCEH